MKLIKPKGIVGLVVPSGIASDKSASIFFKSVSTTGRVSALLDFENRGKFFPDVHNSFKFCALVMGGKKRKFKATDCAFFLRDVKEVDEKSFQLSADDFNAVNPNTGTAPIFRTRRDADITTSIYKKIPVLVDRRGSEPVSTWPVKYNRMFDMTNDSHLFKTKSELEEEGYPVAGNRWRIGDEEFLPLYEGKMVQAYDHRAANIIINPENLKRPAQPEPSTLEQHQNPNWLPNPQYWVNSSLVSDSIILGWVLGFKEITASTNTRTFIAAMFPMVGFGNKVPLLFPSHNKKAYKCFAPLMLANLNCMCFDYVTRQKIHGQTLNWYIVEQLPVLPEKAYSLKIGDITAAELVRREVLKLTYTAHDMEPFARDMGYEGKPFVWDEEERRHLRARLDALYFILYDIDRDDADYILSTFPIVEKQDRKEFDRYLTRDLILAYMNALKAGDHEAIIDLR